MSALKFFDRPIPDRTACATRSPWIVGLGFWLLALAFIPGCGDDRTPDDPEAEIQAAKTLTGAGARISSKGGRVGLLDFSGKKVSDADFANIAKLTLLQQLMLAGSTFDDASLAHLTSLKEVGQMSLKASSLSDAGLEHIGALKSLTELDLEGTKITDAGLEQLTGLTRLQKLYITGSAATPDGASKLKQSLPKLTVYGP